MADNVFDLHGNLIVVSKVAAIAKPYLTPKSKTTFVIPILFDFQSKLTDFEFDLVEGEFAWITEEGSNHFHVLKTNNTSIDMEFVWPDPYYDVAETIVMKRFHPFLKALTELIAK